MIKVYFSDKHCIFLIFVSSQNLIIKSATKTLKSNKRWRPRAKFFHPQVVDLELLSSGIDLDYLPSFNITEKEFVEWIGKIGIDEVSVSGSIDDIVMLMRVKREYENKIKDNNNS